MNVISRKLIVVLLAGMLITSACAQGRVNSPVQENSQVVNTAGQDGNRSIVDDENSDSANTNNEQSGDVLVFTSIILETSLEENSTVTKTIGAEGGTLVTTAANGTQYKLLVPEGALLFDEDISMTPLASAKGEVIGDSFLGGVKLEPEDLVFLELVSIEVVNPGIKVGAIGFTGQSEGQDFHMIPASSTDGSVTITTTHFTEFVISQDMVEGIFELGELANAAWLEHQLAKGSESEQIAALDKILNELINTGERGIDLKNWEPWTGDLLSFLLRSNEITAKNKWNENTPGFAELISKMQSLIDLWFEQSEALINELVGKCIQGEIIYATKIFKITNVGYKLDGSLHDLRREQLYNWTDKMKGCLTIYVSWQANVVATGSGFMSDISVGAETSLLFNFSDDYSVLEQLEVEYVEGFWHVTCKEQNGKIELLVEFPDRKTNLGIDELLGILEEAIYDGITIKVKIIENVFIDCGQGLIFNAQAQAPFHGAAFDALNLDRKDSEGYWVYELEYNPGGGVVGQIEEGPESLSKSDVNYKVWQLVTIMNAIPAD